MAAFIAKPFIAELLTDLGLFSTDADAAKDATERLKDKIKELTDKPHKLAIDIRDIEEAEKKLSPQQKTDLAKLRADQAQKTAAAKAKAEKQQANAKIKGMMAAKPGKTN